MDDVLASRARSVQIVPPRHGHSSWRYDASKVRVEHAAITSRTMPCTCSDSGQHQSAAIRVTQEAGARPALAHARPNPAASCILPVVTLHW